MPDKPIYYTGIGSRQTPISVLQMMHSLATDSVGGGFVLRSGGAPGADTAFEQGCDAAHGSKEIYLPFDNFNGHRKSFVSINARALEIAAFHHPNWPACSPIARKMHARNAFQILGADLDTPSKFVICWTVNGQPIGGTGQALRMAAYYKIPVVNLFGLTTTEIHNRLNKIIE